MSPSYVQMCPLCHHFSGTDEQAVDDHIKRLEAEIERLEGLIADFDIDALMKEAARIDVKREGW